MTINNSQPAVEVSNPSRRPHRGSSQDAAPTPSDTSTAGRKLLPPQLTFREAVHLVRIRYRDIVSELEIGLLAVALMDRVPLDADTSERDRTILRWATELMAHGCGSARAAISAARAAAQARHASSSQHQSAESLIDTLTLEEAIRIPALSTMFGLKHVSHTERRFVPSPSFVLLEHHTAGRHTLELWGTPPEPPFYDTAPSVLAGAVIGLCMRCGASVSDRDFIFAAWDGNRWRFSGYTLPGSTQLATLRPLLCNSCAIRAKYKLIRPPVPTIGSPDGSGGHLVRAVQVAPAEPGSGEPA